LIFKGVTPSGFNRDRTGAAMAGGVYDHRGRGLPSTSISEKCGVALETFLRDDGAGRKGDRRRFRHSHVRRRFAGLKNWKAVRDDDAVAMYFAVGLRAGIVCLLGMIFHN
jgi:hypothetical protein